MDAGHLGGEEPSFADGDEAAAVLEGIRRRHDQLGRDIENGKFKPIFWIDTDGLVIAVDWRERRAGQPISRAVTSKPGRNDPCSCGSGKKFKKFCGA